jgi:hypothetical protein
VCGCVGERERERERESARARERECVCVFGGCNHTTPPSRVDTGLPEQPRTTSAFVVDGNAMKLFSGGEMKAAVALVFVLLFFLFFFLLFEPFIFCLLLSFFLSFCHWFAVKCLQNSATPSERRKGQKRK